MGAPILSLELQSALARREFTADDLRKFEEEFVHAIVEEVASHVPISGTSDALRALHTIVQTPGVVEDALVLLHHMNVLPAGCAVPAGRVNHGEPVDPDDFVEIDEDP